MKKSMVRATLFSSVTFLAPAIPAAVAFVPTEADAATVCTGNNNGTTIDITCKEGTTVLVASGTTKSPASVLAPSEGLSIISFGDADITLVPGSATNNTIKTDEDATPGMILTATGNLAVSAPDVNVNTIGFGSDGADLTGANITATLGNLTVTDSTALNVSSAGTIDVTTGDLFSLQEGAHIAGGAGPISLTTGNVGGSEIDAIFISGTGAITLHAGNLSSNAPTSVLDIVGGAGPINATVGNVTGFDPQDDGINISGIGSISLTTGVVTMSHAGVFAFNSPGIVVTGGAGAISVNTAGVATTGPTSDGVHITGTGSVSFTNTGNITTTGASSNAIDISGFTTANVACGDASTTADSTPAVLILGNGDTNVTCGTVMTTGAHSDAIDVGNTAGNTTVSGTTTSATGTGSSGIVVNSTSTGLVTVNTGNVTADGAAVFISSSGNIVLNATGNVTSLGLGGIALWAVDNGGAGFGAITATIGGNIRADGSPAILLQSTNSAGTGNVTLTSNAGTTIKSSGSVGIQATSAGSGNVSVTNNSAIGSAGGGPNTLLEGIAVASLPTGTGNVQITNNGSIGSLNDVAQSAGMLALIGNAASAGSLTVNGSGAIFSLGDGIDALNFGTGGATVNYTGRIDSDSDGIHVNTTTGAISVTTGGAEMDGFGGDGIRTTSTTGNQTITTSNNVIGIDVGIQALATTGTLTVNVTGGTVGGVTAGIELDSNGAKTVNVSSGATVEDGGPPAGVSIFGGSGGTLTVNNSGQVGLVGSTAVATQSITRAMINNLSGGRMDGRVDLSFLNDSISNTGTWNATGANNFYDGVDVVANNAGGVINTANGTTFDALEAFTNAGTVSTTGTLGFTTFATTLTNSGTFNLGAGSVVTGLNGVTSSGTINAGAGSSISGTGPFSSSGRINTAGAFTIAGFTALSNSGTLNLGPGTLTVPAVLFTNSGTINATSGASTITGQTGFDNSGTINLSDGATGDVLTIDSNFTGSGASELVVDAGGNASDKLVITGAASGTTQLFANIGSVITTPVLVVDTGTSTPDAFLLGSNVATPLIDVTLTRTGQDFFLTSAPNANAFQPLVLGAVAEDLWYQSADAYGAYSAQRRGDLGSGVAAGLGLWGQVYWNHELSGDKRNETVFGTPMIVDSRISTRRRGMQGGLDYGLGFAVIGITGGYEAADVNLRSTPGGFDLHGYNIGAYAIAGHDLGFYGGLLAKYDRAHAESTNPAFADVDSVTLKSTGVEGEAGYRFGFAGVKADLGAGLAWVHSKVEDFASGGIAFDFDTANSLRGRLGARIEGGPGLYLDARVLHEFRGESGVTLVSGGLSDSLTERGRGTWGRVEAGIAGRGRVSPMAAVWGEFGDVRGWGFRAGLRFGGPGEAPVAYVPPPAPLPPPPSPAPPASQTCPDGAVIDAAATCPAPPPPPAPVERGERGN